MPALTDHGSEIRRLLAGRLAAEFASFDHDDVERCVADVQARMTHLGVEATPALVERMAREHLVGMEKSRPPSGRVGQSRPGGDPDGPVRPGTRRAARGA